MAKTDLAEMENEKAFEKVKKFLKDGCGCAALGAKGGPCSGQFTETVVLFNLNNCSMLQKQLYLMKPVPIKCPSLQD